MKIMEILDGRCHHIYHEFDSMEQAREAYPDEAIELVEAPDNVWEGYGYDPSKKGDDRFIRPLLSEGWEWDDNGLPYNPLDMRNAERDYLLAIADADSLEAFRMIRAKNEEHDWEGWLSLLEIYIDSIKATVEQDSYPNKVEYPDYPVKPWE